jgi:transposase
VHADGYAGFNGLFGEDKASEVACMAHIRRKFVDVQQSQGSAIAEEAIKRIARLYGIEKEARGCCPEDRAVLRQKNAKPIFDNLESWLHAQLPKISGKSPLARAIRYALSRMPKTRPYLGNGFLELDNNICERAVKASGERCVIVHPLCKCLKTFAVDLGLRYDTGNLYAPRRLWFALTSDQSVLFDTAL